MNKYESIIIIKPNENKEEINKTLDKFKKQIESFSNKNVNMEDLGEKRLAYEIQGNQKGYYAWTDNLPYEYVRITKLFTGTNNEDLDYTIKYKTNKSEDYIEYGKYNTQKNN